MSDDRQYNELEFDRARFTERVMFNPHAVSSIAINGHMIHAMMPDHVGMIELDESAVSPMGKLIEAQRHLNSGDLDRAGNALFDADECMQILLARAAWHRAQAKALEEKYNRFNKQRNRYNRRLNWLAFRSVFRRKHHD